MDYWYTLFVCKPYCSFFVLFSIIPLWSFLASHPLVSIFLLHCCDFSPIHLDCFIYWMTKKGEKEALICYSCFTKAGNINTHFFPIDRHGTSIFSSAYNISVSASYNAPLLITIRPNNNIMEPVKHTHTWAHKQCAIDRLLCFIEQTHRENCKWNHSKNGSNTHRKKREGWERHNLFWAQPNWPLHTLQAVCSISSG